MAAAVSDYMPAKTARSKIKKASADLTIKLKPTQDILKWAGRNKKKNQILIGFALEDKNLIANAEKKLRQKNLDMIIANQPSAIAANKSTVHVKTKKTGWTTVEMKTKQIIANKIIRIAQEL